MMRFSFCREISLVALAVSLAASSEMMAQPVCGPITLTQNSDPNLVIDQLAIVCAVGQITNTENRYARSYDLSTCSTQGNNFLVNCVDFAVQSNDIAGYTVFVNIYQDLNGGIPVSEGSDLVLLGSASVVIPVVCPPSNVTCATSPENEKHFTADFSLSPVDVPADSVMVVELLLPDRTLPGGDGGLMLPGCNNTGETAVSYVLAPACLGSTFVNVDDFILDQPDAMLIQVVHGEVAEAEVIFCPGDCADGNGSVNVTDLLSLLAGWGQPAQACNIAGGDDTINVTDLLILLGSWGTCPIVRPEFCVGDTDNSGQVNVTDLLALLAAWGLDNCTTTDLNFDGAVNVSDLLLLLGGWGSCPP